MVSVRWWGRIERVKTRWKCCRENWHRNDTPVATAHSFTVRFRTWDHLFYFKMEHQKKGHRYVLLGRESSVVSMGPCHQIFGAKAGLCLTHQCVLQTWCTIFSVLRTFWYNLRHLNRSDACLRVIFTAPQNSPTKNLQNTETNNQKVTCENMVNWCTVLLKWSLPLRGSCWGATFCGENTPSFDLCGLLFSCSVFWRWKSCNEVNWQTPSFSMFCAFSCAHWSFILVILPICSNSQTVAQSRADICFPSWSVLNFRLMHFSTTLGVAVAVVVKRVCSVSAGNLCPVVVTTSVNVKC